MGKQRVAGMRGRHSPSHEKSLRLSNFAPPASAPPPRGDVSAGITNWGVLGNKTHRNCGAAAFQHGRMAKSGRNVLHDSGTDLPADSQAATDRTLSIYFEYGLAMGVPGPQPDYGVSNATWLKFLFEREMIEGYAELDATNADEVHTAMLNFSGVLIGCNLTLEAEQEFINHKPWTITATEQPNPKGGHDVYLVKYDADAGTETVVTWGGNQECTVAWETGEIQDGHLEAWVFITSEDAQRNGVDLTGLQETIRGLGGVTK